jgi:hypothetical protein
VSATAAASCLPARPLRHPLVVSTLVRRRGSAVEMSAGLPVIHLRITIAVPVRPRSVLLVPVVTAEVFSVPGANIGGSLTPA